MSDEICLHVAFSSEERERNVSCEFHQLAKLTFSPPLIFHYLFHTKLEKFACG
jgi:hypothetical protein